jgi:Tol biopolymer transport system component
MSPEQARGVFVDARSDVFSFGVVLYEMLSGKPPFRQEREAAHVTQWGGIDSEDWRLSAPLIERNPSVSPRVAKIVSRCLAREPADRFADGRELLQALDALDELTQPSSRGGARTSQTAYRVLAGVGAMMVVAITTVVLVRTLGRSKDATLGAANATADPATSSTLAFHPKNLRQVTPGDGCEEFPAFTPDGKQVVFGATVGEGERLFVLTLASMTQRQLTDTTQSSDLAPSVSFDGKRVAFLRLDSKTAGTFVVDLEGGSPPRRLANGNMRPSFARDGSLWAGPVTHPTRIDVSTGASLETLGSPLGRLSGKLVELRNGTLVANVATEGIMLFEREQTSGARGAPRWIYRAYTDEVLAVDPTERFVITSAKVADKGRDLVAVPMAAASVSTTGQSLRAAGIDAYKGLDVSPDGHSVVWSTCHARSLLEQVDDRASGNVAPIPDWDVFDAAWLPREKVVAEIANRGASHELWLVDPSGANAPRMIPTASSGHASADGVIASPSGDKLALSYSDAIATMDANGDNLAVVGGSGDSQPTFSHDGREIYFTRAAGQTPLVMAVAASGGDARPLLGQATQAPAASPIDERIAYLQGEREEDLLPMLVDHADSTPRPLCSKLTRGRYGTLRFSPDGTRVVVIHDSRELIEVDSRTGEVVRTIQVEGAALNSVVYANGGLWVIHEKWMGHLWMAEDPF